MANKNIEEFKDVESLVRDSIVFEKYAEKDNKIVFASKEQASKIYIDILAVGEDFQFKYSVGGVNRSGIADVDFENKSIVVPNLFGNEDAIFELVFAIVKEPASDEEVEYVIRELKAHLLLHGFSLVHTHEDNRIHITISNSFSNGLPQALTFIVDNNISFQDLYALTLKKWNEI